MKTSEDNIRLQGIRIDCLTLPGLLGRVSQAITTKARQRIMYVNVHCMNLAYRHRRYRRILNRADTVYCDGTGVVWGAKLVGKHLPPRTTGADWIMDLCRQCQDKGHRLYLLGGKPGIANRAKQTLVQSFPELAIVGTQHGYFVPEEVPAIITAINNASPDILLVGMGSPQQEYWIDDYHDRLQIPVIWAMGAVMDYVAEKVPRAPEWMRQNGLEWLFRLLIEPRRMWQRYVVGNPVFIARMLKARWRLLKQDVT